jgi:predicted ATPase
MYLGRVELRNVLSYESATWDLPPRGLVLLTGRNNAGKTNLMRAVGFLADQRTLPSFLRDGATDGELVATFVLTADDRHHLFDRWRHKDAWLESQAFRELVLRYKQSASGSPILRAIDTTGPDGRARPFAFWNERQSLERVDMDGLAELEPSGAAALFIRNTIAGVEARQGPMVMERYVLESSKIGALHRTWRNGHFRFPSIRPGSTAKRAISEVQPRLAPDGSNLPEVLVYLSTHGDPLWQELQSTVAKVFPNAGTLIAPLDGRNVEVAFHDPHRTLPVNIGDVGAGLQQFLLIAYAALAHTDSTFLAVEEPETSLHNDAQRDMLTSIHKWAEDKVIVLATHSPVFVDRRGRIDSVWHVRRDDGVSCLRQADDIAEAFADTGVRLSDVFAADQILVVEGDTEEMIAAQWFPDYVQDPRNSVIGVGGSDNIWKGSAIERVMASSAELQRKITFLRDRDELPDATIKELEARGIKILPCREIENLLLDAGAIAVVLSEETRAVVTPDEIAAEMRAIADVSKDVVVLKRVVARLQPVRLASRSDVDRLVSNGATIEGLQSLVQERLTEATEKADQLQELWNAEAAYVNERWEQEWAILAPGADILAAIWKRHGAKYAKSKTTIKLASMISPPDAMLDVMRVAFDK